MRRKKLIALSVTTFIAFAIPAAVIGLGSGEEEVRFEEANLFIELNASDEDVGIQVFLDGEPWRKVVAFDPSGARIFAMRGNGSVKRQGLSEFFFESPEPSLDEVPLEEFLDRFPEGVYEFEGVTTDGVEIEGEDTLTHVLPAGPEILAPVSPGEDPPVVDLDTDLLVDWAPVTETFLGSPDIVIIGYQVIVEQEDPLRVYQVDLPPDQTSVRVPKEFFRQRGTLHKFEVLAREVSGNQTISEGEFVTEE